MHNDVDREVLDLRKENKELQEFIKLLASATPENIIVAHAEGRVMVAFSKEQFASMVPDAARAICAEMIKHAALAEVPPKKHVLQS